MQLASRRHAACYLQDARKGFSDIPWVFFVERAPQRCGRGVAAREVHGYTVVRICSVHLWAGPQKSKMYACIQHQRAVGGVEPSGSTITLAFHGELRIRQAGGRDSRGRKQKFVKFHRQCRHAPGGPHGPLAASEIQPKPAEYFLTLAF